MRNINIEELRSQLQQRLDTIQIDEVQITDTSYMDDVQVGIVDTRNPIKQRETYSNDLEGELLQRFDETRDYETRMELSEKIKQERERKLIEKAKEQQRIEKEQKVKAEFVSELKDKQAELSKKIAELQQKIIATEAARVETEDQIEEQQKIVIKGVKAVGEKVYKAAQDEINKNSRSVRSRMARIRKLESQRVEAQADFDSLDAYIKEISLEEKVDEKEERVEEKIDEHEQTEEHSEEDLISAQEDEMWAEYRRKDEQDAKQKAIEEDKAWKRHDMMEKAKEEMIEEQTQEEIKAYNKEQDKKELDDETSRRQAISRQKPKTSSQTKTITADPTQPKAPRTTQETAPSHPSIKSTVQPPKVTEQKKYSIDGIKFYIENGQPIYEVSINSDGQHIEPYRVIGWDNIKTMKPSESQKLLKEIDNPDKYYDQNIASVLEIVDKKYGTNGLAQYMKLLKTKPIKDESEVSLNIDYDFSNLDTVSKENKSITKYIKKLANANYKLGRASYEKSPSLFSRLWNKIKTLKLNSGEMERNIPISNSQYTMMKMGEELESNPTNDNLIEALRSGVQDPDFSISEFAKAYEVSEEEIKEYMKNPKIMGMSRSEAFRLSQRIDRQSLEHQESEPDLNHDEEPVYTPPMHDEK